MLWLSKVGQTFVLYEKKSQSSDLVFLLGSDLLLNQFCGLFQSHWKCAVCFWVIFNVSQLHTNFIQYILYINCLSIFSLQVLYKNMNILTKNCFTVQETGNITICHTATCKCLYVSNVRLYQGIKMIYINGKAK